MSWLFTNRLKKKLGSIIQCPVFSKQITRVGFGLCSFDNGKALPS